MKKVLIIDDQVTYRNGVKHLLEIKFPELVIETANCLSPDELEGIPDLVIVEPNTSFEHSLLLIDFLIATHSKVVILSTPDKGKKRMLTLLKRNIQGFLLKNMRTDELLNCIQTILSGNRYIHPQVANVLLDAYQNQYSIHNQKQTKSIVL